jgi:hypothetical protein
MKMVVAYLQMPASIPWTILPHVCPMPRLHDEYLKSRVSLTVPLWGCARLRSYNCVFWTVMAKDSKSHVKDFWRSVTQGTHKSQTHAQKCAHASIVACHDTNPRYACTDYEFPMGQIDRELMVPWTSRRTNPPNVSWQAARASPEPGGIQVYEPSNENPTTVLGSTVSHCEHARLRLCTWPVHGGFALVLSIFFKIRCLNEVLLLRGLEVDSVRRFGGSTAPNMPWPQELQKLWDLCNGHHIHAIERKRKRKRES